MNVIVIISRNELQEDDITRADALASCCASAPGIDVLLVPDLYDLADASPLWAQLAALPGQRILVTPLHARPALARLRQRGVDVNDLLIFPWADASPERCWQAIRDAILPDPALPAGTVLRLEEPTRERWYPIIDTRRCINCRHCLQFCLFDVYTAGDDGRITVTHPDQCKHGCPACSRICPQGAIIFPRYAKDQAIAGAPGVSIARDLKTQRMYYLRTGLPCPQCGSTDTRPALLSLPVDEAACPECGRPQPDAAPAATFSDLDDLIDQLDDLTQRRP